MKKEFEDIVNSFWSEYKEEFIKLGLGKMEVKRIINSYFDMVSRNFNADGLPVIRLPYIGSFRVSKKWVLRDLSKAHDFLKDQKNNDRGLVSRMVLFTEKKIRAYITWLMEHRDEYRHDYQLRQVDYFIEKYKYLLY